MAFCKFLICSYVDNSIIINKHVYHHFKFKQNHLPVSIIKVSFIKYKMKIKSAPIDIDNEECRICRGDRFTLTKMVKAC